MGTQAQTIAIATADGSHYETPVLYRSGSWVVLQPGGARYPYSLTHAPTGMRALAPKNLAAAKRACREAAARMPRELDALTPGQDPRTVLPADVLRACAEITRELKGRYS